MITAAPALLLAQLTVAPTWASTVRADDPVAFFSSKYTWLIAGESIPAAWSTRKTCSAVDFNRDVFDDVICIETSTGRPSLWMGAGRGRGFEPEVTWSSSVASGAGQQLFGDVDGDGRVDLVSSSFTSVDVARSHRGSSYDGPDGGWYWKPPTSWLSGFGCEDHCAMDDVDGDGLHDIVFFPPNHVVTTPLVALSTGGGFAPPMPATAAPFCEYGTTCLLGDVTGDGRADLVAVHGDDSAGAVMMAPSRGSGTTSHGSPRTWLDTGLGSGDPQVVHALADINGDTLLDLVAVNDHAHPEAVRVCPSTASSFACAHLFDEPNGHAGPGFRGPLPVVYFMEMNGDGKTDLLSTTTGGAYGAPEFQINYSLDRFDLSAVQVARLNHRSEVALRERQAANLAGLASEVGETATDSISTGCADDDLTHSEYFGGSVWGCGGSVTFGDRDSLCAADYEVCSVHMFSAQDLRPFNNYWAEEELYVVDDEDGCFVSDDEGVDGATGGRICGSSVDRFDNTCLPAGCGLETPGVEPWFGGEESDETAGTLCCPTLAVPSSEPTLASMAPASEFSTPSTPFPAFDGHSRASAEDGFRLSGGPRTTLAEVSFRDLAELDDLELRFISERDRLREMTEGTLNQVTRIQNLVGIPVSGELVLTYKAFNGLMVGRGAPVVTGCEEKVFYAGRSPRPSLVTLYGNSLARLLRDADNATARRHLHHVLGRFQRALLCMSGEDLLRFSNTLTSQAIDVVERLRAAGRLEVARLFIDSVLPLALIVFDAEKNLRKPAVHDLLLYPADLEMAVRELDASGFTTPLPFADSLADLYYCRETRSVSHVFDVVGMWLPEYRGEAVGLSPVRGPSTRKCSVLESLGDLTRFGEGHCPLLMMEKEFELECPAATYCPTSPPAELSDVASIIDGLRDSTPGGGILAP
ncbi:MAG: VCBS repeat-containing protein, partial [Myxococcota bacterium]